MKCCKFLNSMKLYLHRVLYLSVFDKSPTRKQNKNFLPKTAWWITSELKLSVVLRLRLKKKEKARLLICCRICFYLTLTTLFQNQNLSLRVRAQLRSCPQTCCFLFQSVCLCPVLFSVADKDCACGFEPN